MSSKRPSSKSKINLFVDTSKTHPTAVRKENSDKNLELGSKTNTFGRSNQEGSNTDILDKIQPAADQA